jgi:hypothetical protein
MSGPKERNCQIRMSSSLWNLVGEIAQEFGHQDARGRHSPVIREMIAAAAARWTHSPYVCRSARHTVYVAREGSVFSRQVEIFRLNTRREKLPCVIEMKPEKRDYYHRKYRKLKNLKAIPKDLDEFKWFNNQWLLNYFAVWGGKNEADDLDAFSPRPLSSHIDTFGPTYKSADLAVHALGGRFLTREITVALRDYVQWQQTSPAIPGSWADTFDRVDIPIDIPTSDLEVCVVVDLDLFAYMDITRDEIANLALEFRNREAARFEGKEVALYPEIRIEEQFGRAPADEGVDEMALRIRRLRQRILTILDSTTTDGRKVSDHADKESITATLRQPQDFLFYWLRWPSPHVGIEACVRWEKPVPPPQPGGQSPETGSKPHSPTSNRSHRLRRSR